MLELRPLSLNVTINGDSLEFSGMDFVQMAIEVMKEIEEEILAQGDTLKPDGDGSEESPYVLKSNKQWLYAALEIIKPNEKKESYWRIGNRIIKCTEADRYMIDCGNLDKIFESIIDSLSPETTVFFQEITRLHLTKDDIRDGSIYHKGLRYGYVSLTLIILTLIALMKNQNTSSETKARLKSNAEKLLNNYEKIPENFRKHIEPIGKEEGPPYSEIQVSVGNSIEMNENFLDINNTNELIASHILNLIDSNKIDPFVNLLDDFIPITAGIFFLSEVGRNPVTFLINKILFSMIASGSKGSHFLKNLNICTMLWCEDPKAFINNMYGIKKEAVEIGGLHPMAHKGSFEKEFKDNGKDHRRYQFDPPFSTARQKESLVLTEWICIQLNKVPGVTAKIISATAPLNPKQKMDVPNNSILKKKSSDSTKTTIKYAKAEFLEHVVKPMMRDMILSPQPQPSSSNNNTASNIPYSSTTHSLFSYSNTSNLGNQNLGSRPPSPANKK